MSEPALAPSPPVEAATLTGEGETSEPVPPPPPPTALTLEGEMTIYRAVELKDAMLGALRSSGPVELDLSGVTEIDSAGVQVLLLGKQLAGARDQELRLTAISPAVDEVLALLALRRHLGLEQAEAAPPGPQAKATES